MLAPVSSLFDQSALTDRAERLVKAARAHGADAADAVAVRSLSLSVELRDGAVEETDSAEADDLGLRVLVGKRQAVVSSNDLTGDVDALAARAVAMARAAPEDKFAGLAEPELLAHDWLDLDLIDRETNLSTPGGFRDIVLREDDAGIVRLGDVARVELGPEEERQITRFTGRESVGLGLVRQSTANPLTIARDLRTMLPAVQSQLPPDVEVRIAFDSTLFIDASIRSVYETILEAIALVVLVIFLFLRSWRASLVPIVTIPVSLIGAFALMYASGFTINTLTLLALVLAIGLVVDDAIVMLENIYRHVEAGMPPMQAALQGSREIGFAVIAMTITLAAVFAPIAFTEGQTGKLFVEFALALARRVLVSGVRRR